MSNIKSSSYFIYTTSEGDMFDSIALSAYNEETMSTEIIAENPQYSDVIVFEAGIKLKIPIFEEIETNESLPPWRQPL